MTTFLPTTLRIAYPAVYELQRIAARHGCLFERPSRRGGGSPVRCWFSGPSLDDSAEAAREASILDAIRAAGIHYPRYE